MIITRNWISEFIDISKISTNDICKTLNSIGLEVDSVKKIDIPETIVIGKVLKCEKHPNADKLSLCQIDIGDKIEQIICGAKNIDVNQYVPVATIGTILNNNLEIKKAKLRDIESFGMVCSSSELGLSEMGDGILILDDSIGELKIGKSLREYEIFNDDIIEIELTANRGDCLSIYGIARELSTAFNIQLKKIENFDYEGKMGIGRVLYVSSDNNINSSLFYKAFL